MYIAFQQRGQQALVSEANHASKASDKVALDFDARAEALRQEVRRVVCASICTRLLVKQANWVLGAEEPFCFLRSPPCIPVRNWS